MRPAPRRDRDPVGQPVLGAAVVRRAGLRAAEPKQGGQGQRAGDGDQGQQAEEDPAPAGQARHRRAHRGTDQAGDHPGSGQHRHHPGPEAIGQAPSDRDVRDGRHGTRADALERPAGHQHQHARRETGDGQPGAEQHEPAEERPGRAVGCPPAARRDDAENVAEHERAEDPAVQAQSVQVARHKRHDRHDGQRLGRDERDRQDEAEGEGPVLRRPQALGAGGLLLLGFAGPGACPRGHATSVGVQVQLKSIR